ncbi:hypothetical protein ISE1_1642 [plant metagenome]|uniref:Uncharacterized protein n=1 Tax=plant metagenome TaxID=1297885 RepID=A0A484SAV4_9ZZZZ
MEGGVAHEGDSSSVRWDGGSLGRGRAVPMYRAPGRRNCTGVGREKPRKAGGAATECTGKFGCAEQCGYPGDVRKNRVEGDQAIATDSGTRSKLWNPSCTACLRDTSSGPYSDLRTSVPACISRKSNSQR